MKLVDVIGLLLNSTPPSTSLHRLPWLLHPLSHHHLSHCDGSLGYNRLIITAAKGEIDSNSHNEVVCIQKPKSQSQKPKDNTLRISSKYHRGLLFPFKLTICCCKKRHLMPSVYISGTASATANHRNTIHHHR